MHWECWRGNFMSQLDLRLKNIKLNETRLALEREMSYLSLLALITREAFESTSVDMAISSTLYAVCDFMNWPLGHGWLRKGSMTDCLLVSSKKWHVDEPEVYDGFVAASQNMELVSGQELPGQVCRSGRAAWITDVGAETDFLRQPSALAAGLHAGFAFPVLSENRVEAVLEFFSNNVETREPRLLEIMEQIGIQLGRVIERKRAENAIFDLNQVLTNDLDGVSRLDDDGHYVMVNQRYADMLGCDPEEMIGRGWEETIAEHEKDRMLELWHEMKRTGRVSSGGGGQTS